MTRVVVIEDNAEDDIRRIAGFIRLHVSRKSSDRWTNQIQSTLDSLDFQAERWPSADDPGLDGTGIRVRLMGRRPHVYRILFLVANDRVLVYRIRHAAQDSLGEDDL